MTHWHTEHFVEAGLEVAAKVAMLVFVVACMAAAGLSLGIRAVVAPLRRARFVVFALVANFVFAPAVALAVAAAFALDGPRATGLIMLGGAAGAPFLPKLAELARGDVASAVALMLLLTAGSVVFMPVALPLLSPGLTAETWPILRPLLGTMLVPLAAGMLVRGRSERWANRLGPPLRGISNVSMTAAMVLLIAINWRAMMDTLGSGALAAAALFVLVVLALGYALGGPSPTTRSVLGLGTGQRNIAAALIVATGNSADAQVVVMLLVSTLVGLLVLVPAAFYFARRPLTEGMPVARTADTLLPEEAPR